MTFQNLRGRRVAVADRYPGSATSLALLIRSNGSDVRVCESGEEAVALSEQWQPELLVIDLLCSPDALNCVRQVQALSASCAVLAVHSMLENDLTRQAQEARLTVLAKPICPELFLATCDELLSAGHGPHAASTAAS